MLRARCLLVDWWVDGSAGAEFGCGEMGEEGLVYVVCVCVCVCVCMNMYRRR